MMGQAAASQMEFDAAGIDFAGAYGSGDKSKKRGSTFLKMFRFDKARTPKNAQEESTALD